ncbi:hypothetical protein [Thermococcus sp. LS1]|uniref:hypothetical protein n=1 Tax=Thermococcus sp. LS1 TaxID=1638259 RepID=UPI00143979EA|nr:hypothetical protein [Thermococcus sp. LS1]
MNTALLYLLPGIFWGVYYYHFVREVLNEKRISFEDKIWYLLFMIIGVSVLFIGAALSSTGIQFFVSVAVWIFILVLFGRTEEKIRDTIRILRDHSIMLLPTVFISIGILVYIAVPAPLNLIYLLTFIAIGGTIYEWELERK